MEATDTATRAAQAMGALRVALGGMALVAPGPSMSVWIGTDALREPDIRLLSRALGARDVGLGLGAVLAVRRGRSPRGWLEAAMLADLTDAVVSIAAWRRLPRSTRWLVPLAGLSAVATAAVLVRRLPATRDEPGN